MLWLAAAQLDLDVVAVRVAPVHVQPEQSEYNELSPAALGTQFSFWSVLLKLSNPNIGSVASI